MLPGKFRAIPPPLLFLLCLILGSALHRVHPLLIAPYSFVAGIVAGSMTVAVAAGLGVWGIHELKTHGTSIEPGNVPTALVTTGPFRLTRNPLYLALLAVLTGVAIMINSAWLLFSTVLLLLLLDRLVVRREEAINRDTFGAEYSQYIAHVRRWV